MKNKLLILAATTALSFSGSSFAADYKLEYLGNNVFQVNGQSFNGLTQVKNYVENNFQYGPNSDVVGFNPVAASQGLRFIDDIKSGAANKADLIQFASDLSGAPSAEVASDLEELLTLTDTFHSPVININGERPSDAWDLNKLLGAVVGGSSSEALADVKNGLEMDGIDVNNAANLENERPDLEDFDDIKADPNLKNELIRLAGAVNSGNNAEKEKILEGIYQQVEDAIEEDAALNLNPSQKLALK